MYGPSPAERIAMARRLMARHRWQEALDLLNEAVRQDPRQPDTFETRADVFELMGLYPHAQADRRKAADIRATLPAAPPPSPPPPSPPPEAIAPEPTPPTPVEPPASVEPSIAEPPSEWKETVVMAREEPAEPETDIEEEGGPDAVGEVMEEAEEEAPAPEPEPVAITPAPEPVPVPSFIQPDRTPEPSPPPEPEQHYTPDPEPVPQYTPEPEYQPAVPAYMGPPRPSVSGAILRASSVVLFALGVFIAIGVGIFLAMDAVQGDDDSPFVGTSPTPAASGDATEGAGEPTEAADIPAGTVEDALRGDPFGFSSVQTAWETAGFTVTVGDFSQEVTGFSEDAVDLQISRDGLSMELSILMYDGSASLENDWSLSVPVTPRLDGQVPDGSQAWYNANVVVVVRITDDTLKPDALEAFIDMS